MTIPRNRPAGSASKAVLITGCSSGIGEETARHLAAKGWTVYATARRPETLANLEAAGCKTLACDVTDEGSMRAVVDAVVAAEGAVGVLVNNAGYSQSGAVESVDMDSIRRQFETNVFGLIRMSQLVLPGMRDQGWGRIVNLSSMGGRLTFPGGGIYHATKHSVEAICDAMRFEVAGFGVDVVCVEPGLIVTGFGGAAARSLEEGAAAEGPYGEFNARVGAATEAVYKGPMRRLGGGPETVARTIEKAITAHRPRSRYKVTPSARMAIAQRRLVSDRVWDRAMAAQFPRPVA
jgi:NAD(P)-dependent dehydrogenase (short-subunit alcohol dehydrogenase family)